MPFEKGKSGNPNGRPVGAANKLTSDIKGAIEQAFSELGGAEYLKKIAIMDAKAFCALLGKVLPKDVQISGADGQPLKIIIVTGVPEKKDQDADQGS